jgi:hypothetical protein
MAGTKTKRKRALEKRIGTIGTDPFIPARMPGQAQQRVMPVAPPALSAGRGRRSQRRLWGSLAVLGVVVLVVGGLLFFLHYRP